MGIVGIHTVLYCITQFFLCLRIFLVGGVRSGCGFALFFTYELGFIDQTVGTLCSLATYSLVLTFSSASFFLTSRFADQVNVPNVMGDNVNMSLGLTLTRTANNDKFLVIISNTLILCSSHTHIIQQPKTINNNNLNLFFN